MKKANNEGPWVSREVAGYVVRARLRDKDQQVYGCRFEIVDASVDFAADSGPRRDEPNEVVLHGWVKWDGCGHLMSRQDVYVHVCAADGWENLVAAMAAVYPLCAEVMPDNLTNMEPMPALGVKLTSEQLDALIDAAQSRRDQTGRNDHLDAAIDVLEQAQELDLAAASARLCRCGARFPAADDPARCATCQAIARETGR